jgi:hypothetical protein
MEYKRKCPGCNREHTYSSAVHLKRAIKIGGTCIMCCNQGKNNPMYGKTHTEEAKSRMPLFKKGQSAWNKGLPQTKEQIEVNSKSHIGQNIGIKRSEETKRKHRINALNRLRDAGIGVYEDKGAREWFDKLNEKEFNYKPKRFFDLGYDADGYDEKLHIWYEYDTPYHFTVHQKKKDLVRQENIINHFKSIGKPLRYFIRAQVNDENKVLCETYINK